MEQQNYMVCVRCFTYNHAPYIEDALNGFCMQETTFPFVCTIVDDASTDGEQKVIKKYLQEHFDLENKAIVRNEETDDYVMNFAQHKENKNCYFAIYFLKYNHYNNPEIKKRKLQYISGWHENCKYIATCEGDDYWIETKKLQKQIEAMEKNHDLTMVYTSFTTVNTNGEVIYRESYEKYKKISKSGDILPLLFVTNFPLTLTTLFRREVFDSGLYLQSPSKIDYSVFMAAAFIGDAYYIPKECGAYRSTPNGLMHSNLRKVKMEYSKAFSYYSREYAKGNHKKETFWNDIRIKYRIMLYAITLLSSHKDNLFLYDIIKSDISFIFFIGPIVVKKCVNRVTSFLSECKLILFFIKRK